MNTIFRTVTLSIVLISGCSGARSTDQDVITDPSDATDVTEGDSSVDIATDGTPCSSDEDCDNGIYCDGAETCEANTCAGGDPVVCDDDDSCTTDTCDEDTASCVFDGRDEDSDGFIDLACSGNDCDDNNADIYPGAPRSCGDSDFDCSGEPDNDEDGDGHIDALLCPDTGDDCDDTDNTIHAGAEPVCDGEDHDCSGHPDQDEDEDGFLSSTVCPETGDDCDDTDADVHPGAVASCQDLDVDCDGDIENDIDADGYTSTTCGGDDCDDTDDTIHPTATEICDLVDQDCDLDLLDAADADDDGDTVLDSACGGSDCDDTNETVYPGAPELCDSLDTNCSSGGGADDTEDADGDGHADEGSSCIETGMTMPRDDCRDDLPDVHPGQTMFFTYPACPTGLLPCRWFMVTPPTGGYDVWYCLPASTTCVPGQPHLSAPGDPEAFYDYDCDGTEEPQPPIAMSGCGSSPCDGAPCMANSGYRDSAGIPCGEDAHYLLCGGGFCTTCSIDLDEMRPMACL